MKKVAVIILHFNNEQDTKECLASLHAVDTKGIEVQTIVVDNGSKDVFSIRGFKVIRNNENLGFAGGNNVGISYALGKKADYIILLNNDTFVDRHLIKELVKVAEQDAQAGILAPKIYFAKGFEFHKNRYKKEDLGKVLWYAGGIMDWDDVIGHHRGVDEVDHGQYDEEEETDFASGCCMLLRSDALRKVGLFDEKYFLYYEDSDLNQRFRNKGYSIRYVPKAVLWHKNAGSAGGSGSSLQDYYISRNRLLFGIRYAPAKSKFALLKESIRLLANGRKWQKRGVLDFYFGRFGKGSYPI